MPQKNPSRKKTFSKIQHYSKHILLQTPAKTTRNHPHCICMGSPPRLIALQNARKTSKKSIRATEVFLRRFSTIQRVSNTGQVGKKPMGFKPEIDQRVRKKTTSISGTSKQHHSISCPSVGLYQHLDLDETKVRCCFFFRTFWVICSFQNSKVQITLNLGSAISRGYNL